MNEEWRPIVGYEGIYEVSSLGRVRSLDRFVDVRLPNGAIGKRPVTGRVLKPGRQKDGNYPYVNLSSGHKRQQTKHVHRLVMDAFVGTRPNGMEVRHLDGDPANNTLVNLAYGTRSENCYDTVRHGRNRQATKTHCKRGHELLPANLSSGGISSRGSAKRDCKICARVRYHEGKPVSA